MRRALYVTLAVLACFLGAWQSAYGGSPNPYMWISKVTIDTVSLTTPSRVTVEVAGGSRGGLTNVSAWIDTGQGYKIISQPTARTDTLHRGKTFSFTGTIQAVSKGAWPVNVTARGTLWDGTTGTQKDMLYIYLSDTLSGVVTPYQEQFLMPTDVKLPPQLNRDSITILPPLPAGPRPKPYIPDSLLQKRNQKGKRSGTFNIFGYLLYHDARDPQGTFRPAISCNVEVWNDNEYDNPSSSDTYLGTATTLEDGCFSLQDLDNSDGDGSADPYLNFKTENDSWVVAPSLGGNPYDWFSPIVRNVSNNSTVNFGTSYIFGGDPYDEGAMWCFQYMNLGWATAWSAGTPPGFVPCVWKANQSYSAQLNGVIFIIASDADAIDMVNHEYAHALMYQGYLGSFPAACPGGQYINMAYCETLGWTEGWAYFFPLVVTQDYIFDFHPSSDPLDHCNLELPPTGLDSLDWGPGCPGRVAGALLDLWDTNNDGLDQNSAYTVSFATNIHERNSISPRQHVLRVLELPSQQRIVCSAG